MNSTNKIVDDSRTSSLVIAMNSSSPWWLPATRGFTIECSSRERVSALPHCFRWRKKYPQPTPKNLLPIVVESPKMPCEATAGSSVPREVEAEPLGLLEIILGDASIRVSSLVDANVLRMVLEYWRQC